MQNPYLLTDEEHLSIPTEIGEHLLYLNLNIVNFDNIDKCYILHKTAYLLRAYPIEDIISVSDILHSIYKEDGSYYDEFETDNLIEYKELLTICLSDGFLFYPLVSQLIFQNQVKLFPNFNQVIERIKNMHYPFYLYSPEEIVSFIISPKSIEQHTQSSSYYNPPTCVVEKGDITLDTEERDIGGNGCSYISSNLSDFPDFSILVDDVYKSGLKFNIKKYFSIEDDAKIKLLSFTLGSSGFGSRLMDEIRTKEGLAYSVTGGIKSNKSGIYFYGHLQTEVENEEKAIELLKKIIAEFTEKGITADELQSAKNFIIGSEPLRYETTAQKIGKIFTNHYNNREKDYSVKLLEAIENTKLEDLNKFISEHKEINLLSFSILTSK